MLSKNRKSICQKAKFQHLSNRDRENNYDLRFSVTEKKKTYDALEDPHASFYFFSQSVRNHLKNIKTAAIKEQTHTAEKKRLKKLFKQKIKSKPKNILLDYPQINGKGSLLTTQIFRKTSLQPKSSIRYKQFAEQSQRQNKIQLVTTDRFQSLSKRRFNKTQTSRINAEQNFETVTEKVGKFQNESPHQIRQNMDKKRKQLQDRKRKYDQLHDIRHKTFLNFIEQKKKLIQDFQQSVSMKQVK